VESQSGARGLFITGTDTGVGKTIIAAGIVRLARKAGLRCVAIKPVETGCGLRSGVLYPEDGALLVRASGGDIDLDECVPVRFSIPASPARAAAMEGSHIFLSDLVEHARALAERAELVVVEGAGGLMVPIENKLMMIDLIQRLEFPVILVARNDQSHSAKCGGAASSRHRGKGNRDFVLRSQTGS
jgi:dethiobiotin synthetase